MKVQVHVTTPKHVKISTVALSTAWIESVFLSGKNFDRSHPDQRRPLIFFENEDKAAIL